MQNCGSGQQMQSATMSLEERLSKIRDNPRLQGQQQVDCALCGPWQAMLTPSGPDTRAARRH